MTNTPALSQAITTAYIEGHRRLHERITFVATQVAKVRSVGVGGLFRDFEIQQKIVSAESGNFGWEPDNVVAYFTVDSSSYGEETETCVFPVSYLWTEKFLEAEASSKERAEYQRLHAKFGDLT